MKYTDPKLLTRAAKATQDCIAKYGSLYVRVVVPSWAVETFKQGRFSAWCVGHYDPEYLEDEQINSYLSEAFDSDEDRCKLDACERFFEFLKSKDYVVFSRVRLNGFCVLEIEK